MLVFLLLFYFVCGSLAINAPGDGLLIGDECCNFETDHRGVVVIRNQYTSSFLLHNGFFVHKDDYECPTYCINDFGVQSNIMNANGTLMNLVILMRFKDHKHKSLHDRITFDNLFNSHVPTPGAPTGSVKTYFQEQSYNQLTIQSTVTEWVDVSVTELEAAQNCSAMCYVDGVNRFHDAIREAVLVISNQYNFSEFDGDGDSVVDMLTVIHSGYGAEYGGLNYMDRVWSHRWAIRPLDIDGVRVYNYMTASSFYGSSGGRSIRIGVVVHEIGHLLGLPDLYDRKTPISASIGPFDVMCNAYGVDSSMWYPGSFSPWSKIKLGWVTARVLGETGQNTLEPYHSSGDVFLMNHGYPSNQYVLIEARSSEYLYDQQLPPGIYVWHIDENVGNDYNDNQGYPRMYGWPDSHYRVRLIQRDGHFDLEQEDYYYYDDEDAYGFDNSTLGDFTKPSIYPYTKDTCSATGNFLYDFRFNNSGVSYFNYTRIGVKPCEENTTTQMPSPMPTEFVVSSQPTASPTERIRCRKIRNRNKCEDHWENCFWSRQKCRFIRQELL